MDNGKRFALRITALMLCLCAVSAVLSSCGFFADSYLENNLPIAAKTHEKTEKTSPETVADETIRDTTEWDETTKVPETTKTPETTSAPETTKKPETTSAPETTKKPETTSAPETTLSPEQLDNIPDDVQHHVYLKYKNTGRCEELIGKVTVTVIMVNDEVSVWNDAEINKLTASLSSQEKDIEKIAASYGKSLDITLSYMGAKITGDAAAGDYSDGWINATAKSVGYESIQDMQKALDKQNSADSNPILFVLNKTGRAYANYSNGTGAEYCVVFSSDYSSFNHELYHVYGARDFYYPAEVKELTNIYLSGSIMESGKVTDPLTAFIIGWDDEIDTEAYEFLKQTVHLTEAYLEEANKAQSVTGYVTNHKLGYGTYTGYLERGVPTGEGTLTYENGDVASGTFLGGELQGQGSYTWADGIKYVGNFKNNKLEGQGKMTWTDGAYYEGEYKNGERHGTGTYYYSNGNIYSGAWVEGDRIGQGSYTWANGNKYVGNFQNGKFDGQGVYTSTDGYRYEGAWKNDQREGYGVSTWAGGAKHEGNWSADKINGSGKYTYSNGSVYEGNFVDGERSGQGTMHYADGDIYTGEWKAGTMHGQGTYKYVRGHEYTGGWENGGHSGKGYMRWADGSTYDGYWQNSKRHGYGKYINSNGQVFEGQWKNDVFQG